MSIEVTVSLKGPLKKYCSGKGQIRVKLAMGSTVADLLAALGLPERSTGMIALNGKKEKDRAPLADGDLVVIYPPVSGG